MVILTDKRLVSITKNAQVINERKVMQLLVFPEVAQAPTIGTLCGSRGEMIRSTMD